MLDFDDTINIAESTNEGIMKEKIVSQGTAHKIAREESSKQCKRDFTRLKNLITKQLAVKWNTLKNNKKETAIKIIINTRIGNAPM